MKSNMSCKIINILFQKPYKYKNCLTCDVYFWLSIFTLLYGFIINLTLMYGLKKTMKKFKNAQLLQFLLAFTDLVMEVYYAFLYVTLFHLQNLKNGKCILVINLLESIKNTFYIFEPFILNLLIFCRFITIIYPFQNNRISKIVNSKIFIVISLLIYGLVSSSVTIFITISIPRLFPGFHCASFLFFFSTMFVMNLALIIKLRKSSTLTNEETRSLKKQRKAVRTLTIVMITTVLSNIPVILMLLGIVLLVLEDKKTELAQLFDYIELVAIAFILGIGINSNVLLCRNAKIMKLLKTLFSINKNEQLHAPSITELEKME